MPASYEDKVKHCYSTWGETYYDEYYGAKAGYPPVHREILRDLLRGAKPKSLLDAGCGPASFLRDVTDEGYALYGFDLTPEMTAEARRVLEKKGVPGSHVWEGSVTDAAAFRCPAKGAPKAFDAAVCVGVLPHIKAEDEPAVFANLRGSVRKGGLVIIEARNQLFSLFTLNRYSHAFFMDELVRDPALKKKAAKRLEERFRMDLPPTRKGKAGEPGYDEVVSRTHNPLVLKESFARAGFVDVELLFYHYHCLPPMLQAELPEEFLRASLAMEDPRDWRGHFMASAFLLAGRRA